MEGNHNQVRCYYDDPDTLEPLACDAPLHVKDTVTKWLAIASANGFNRLVEAKFKIRLFWFIVIILCYGGMIYHLSFNLSKFLNFGKIMTKFQACDYSLQQNDVHEF